MPTTTPISGYTTWGDGDAFHISEHTANWAAADKMPGPFICTSATRPATWGANQNGRYIIETDTGLMWRWTGTTFVRAGPAGLLAAAVRTTNFSTTSTALVTAHSVTVTIPAGGRTVRVAASVSSVQSTVGVSSMALFRGATQLLTWNQRGGVGGTAQEMPLPAFPFIQDTPAAGTYTYNLQIAATVAFGGTSQINAAVNNPCLLAVVEL